MLCTILQNLMLKELNQKSFNCDEGDGADDELDHLLMQSILENDVRIEQLCL
jgi:hypothetical protein